MGCKSAWVLGAFVLVATFATPVAAADCCAITAINLRTGVVTAEDRTTKRRYQIAINNAVLLNRLKRGQSVDIDPDSEKATIAGIEGRFSLFDENAARAAAASDEPSPRAPEPAASQVAPAAESPGLEVPRPPEVPQFQRRDSDSLPDSSPVSGPMAGNAGPDSPASGQSSNEPRKDRNKFGDRKGVPPRGQKAQDPPDDDANEDDDPDPPKMLRKKGLRLGAGGRSMGKPVRLDKYPDAAGFLRKVADAMTRKEINVSLIGGEKYMVNKCFGIKVRAGNFRMKLASPNARIEGTAAKLTFRVERISMNGISLRMRPSTNVLKPCHFGKKFSVGGAATNVRIEFRFDPIMDFAKCKFGSFGDIHTRVDIGNLNLKPLQNDLDKMAKNAVEDALNNFFKFDPVDQIFRTIDDVLEVDCPGKKM
jgi:hypothetical protein